MKSILILLFVLSTNILLSQVNSFPYTESFEQSFITGSNIDFIPNWSANTIATRNRIFAGSTPRTGEQSLNMIPTSSFKGTIEVSLDLSKISNPLVSFYAYSKKNGSSSSSRPVLLSLATSLDGGSTFSNSVSIGDETTFPNNDSTTYSRYTYELPSDASGKQHVIVKLVAERGDGSGSSAELVIDDFSVESQILPLELISAEATTNQVVALIFNQPISQASAERLENYTVNKGVSIESAQFIAPNSVRLLTSFLFNSNYRVNAFNIQDTLTNILSDTLIADFSFIESLRVLETNILDKRTIELIFNLDLDQISAENPDHYSINQGIGKPLTAGLDEQAKNIIRFDLSSDLQDAEYDLSINGVKDKSTLALAENLVTSFDYLPLKTHQQSIISPTEIALTFNQQVEPRSAQFQANYSFNFCIQTTLVSLSDSTVNLMLNPPLTNNTYSLRLDNIFNLKGNAIAENLLVHLKYETPTLPRQIVINEIFADPSGDHEPDPAILPNDSRDEYVELLNNTLAPIDIGDFQLTGGTIDSFVLEPKNYVILTAHNNLSKFEAFGDVIGVSSWNSLSNNGEAIILTDNLGNVVDSLTYDKSWYSNIDKSDGGWSLEQINPMPSCTGSDNWSSSTSEIGGTPGSQSSIYDPRPDTKLPEVESLDIINDTTLRIVFSETIDTSTLRDENFTSSENLSIQNISILNTQGTEININLKEPIETGLLHSVVLTDINDCAGNSIQEISLDFFLGATPKSNDIIITEIMANPSPPQSLPNAEFLEIYNASNKIISLGGTTIADTNNSTNLGAFDLMPSEYLILTPNSSAPDFIEFGRVLGVSNWINLNNSEDQLFIYNLQNELVSSTRYADSWYRSSSKSQGGYSLEMIDPSYPCLEETNWTASENLSGGSPGKVNSVNDNNPDLQGPKLIQAVAIDGSTIELTFNEKLNTESIDPNDFTGSLGLSFIVVIIHNNERSLLLTTQEDLIENTVYDIIANNITDCSGNLISNSANSIRLIIPAKASPKDILINEVLFNPKVDGVRFIEIYNHSIKYINLKGWKLEGSSNSRVLAEDNLFMPPGSFLTITNDGNTLSNQYPKARSDTFLELTSLPSLSSTEGVVSILTPEEIAIDAAAYSEDYHSPLLSDVEGVSLERIAFLGNSDDPNNWFSASSTEYSATPGYENSQSRFIEVQEGEIWIEPLVFSPESSNAANFVTINYSFQTPGNTLNIKVVDAAGQTVNELGQNIVAGKKGFLTWNGTTNQGGKARIGYYMIFTEIISPTGATRYSRNKVAIGTHF